MLAAGDASADAIDIEAFQADLQSLVVRDRSLLLRDIHLVARAFSASFPPVEVAWRLPDSWGKSTITGASTSGPEGGSQAGEPATIS